MMKGIDEYYERCLALAAHPERHRRRRDVRDWLRLYPRTSHTFAEDGRAQNRSRARWCPPRFDEQNDGEANVG